VNASIDGVANDTATSQSVSGYGTVGGGTDNIETTMEHIYATSGTDSLTGNASVGGYLKGGGSADTINGGSANDTIYGGSGNDLIYGGNGADAIRGENGNDTMYAYVTSTYEDNDIDSLIGGLGDSDVAYLVQSGVYKDIWSEIEILM
jgi:Ca2+-binding RTX toxin-like protein